MPTILSCQDFNRQISQAQKQCEHAPVFVTNRGELSYVLMSYQKYLQLTNKTQNIADALAFPKSKTEIVDIDFERANIEMRGLDIQE